MDHNTRIAGIGRTGRRRLLAVSCAVLLCVPLVAVGLGMSAQDDGAGGKVRHVPSQVPPERLEEVAWRDGQAASERHGPPSQVLTRALDRLQRDPGPPDEVYALVMVTERATGERVVFTRGVPDPEIPGYLRDMENAPPGLAYFETEQADSDDDVVVVVRSVRVRERNDAPGLSRAEEEELALQERNQGGRLNHRIDGALRSRIRSGRVDLSSDTLLPVNIDLRDLPRLHIPKAHTPVTGGLVLAGMELAAERERVIIARKQDVAERQAPLTEAIQAAGGKVIYAAWSSGTIVAQVPAHAIRSLAARPDVFRLDHRERRTENTHFTGNDYRPAFDLGDFVSAGYDGLNGVSSKHSYTSRIVLAMSERCIDDDNPAFQSYSGSFNRGWYYDCDPDPDPCTQWGVESCSGSNSHGTQVAGFMTGDFMDGQDSAVTDEDKMTGTCEECRFFFLQDQNGYNDREKALDGACDLGVDIFESSVGGTSVSCDGEGSYDSSVQSLINCDAVYVQSAGNMDSDTGSCTTGFPADHPWTFTVGGIETRNDCRDDSDYYTSDCIYDQGASRGGATYDSGKGTASIIDMAAPYRVGSALVPLTSGPVSTTQTQGTSFSAPMVAGLMATYMDWWHTEISTTVFYRNRMRNMFLLFGDRSNGSSGSSRRSTGHSIYWGSGRAGLVPFHNKSPWGIYQTICELGRKDTCTFNDSVSTSATFYKAVVWHDGRDYRNEPAIGLTLNPSGCSTSTRSSTRYDSKHMLVYAADASEGELNGCSNVRITIENVPSGVSGSRDFYFAAYYETDDERNY